MECIKARIFYLLAFFLCSQFVSAATVSGKITDENNERLPYVSVYLRGTTQGATSNKEGIFSIELSAGKQELVFQYIGYKTHSEVLNVENAEQKIILNVKMEPQPYKIVEVTVTANAEDPAYEIMRKAIKMRRFYLNQVLSYSCDVYIKGIQKMTSYPKKFMGFDVNAEGNIDPKTGIFYLSESVAKFYFAQPNKIYEAMISSKVSGNSKAFSYNRTSDLLLDFYKNIVDVKVVSQRGFVSPIAEGAMFYYKYHFAGTFYENGKAINKIQIIPKRNHDPVFRGYIYICENTWRIHSADLFLVKDAGIQFVDTLRINHVYLPVGRDLKSQPTEDEVWMLFSNKLTFSFSLLGFKGNGMYLSIHSKYNVKPNFSAKNPFPQQTTSQTTSPPIAKKILKEKKSRISRDSSYDEKEAKEEKKLFSSGEIMKVNDDANKKDTTYWTEMRPVPLTSEEALDYKKKDSIQIIHESKPFLDSVDKKTNTFRAADLLFGYSYSNRYKKRNTDFSPLIKNVQFNSVQGFVGAMELRIEREYDLQRRFIKKFSASYGFADEKWNGAGALRYEYDPKKIANAEVRVGLNTVQFFSPNAASFRDNHVLPISPFINSLYSLLDEKNYIKLYEKRFLELSHSSEIKNGLFLKAALEYGDRLPLMNKTNFSFVNKTNSTYTSNDPLFPNNDSAFSFSQNQLLEFSLNLRIRFAQKYVTRPDEKWISGSKYPSVYIKYRKGIPNVFGSDMNYDFVKLSITDRMDFKLLGKARYIVSAGNFLSAKNISFMDYNHFFGNQTIYSNFTFTSFQLLDYYAYSTKNYFVEAHYEHDFSGFILNKFPLLRKLKLNELTGAHYLHTENLPNYVEVFFGIEKLNIARADFVMSFSEDGEIASGFRVGLKIGR